MHPPVKFIFNFLFCVFTAEKICGAFEFIIQFLNRARLLFWYTALRICMISFLNYISQKKSGNLVNVFIAYILTAHTHTHMSNKNI